MSKDLKNNSSEEIDIIQLFDFFESKVIAFFCLFYKGFKFLFEIFISFLKIIKNHILKILILLFFATILGFVYDIYQPKVYSSKMIVKPLFDSKYQLITNVRHYNELVNNNEYEKLSKIFNIKKDVAKGLISFNIIDGPESERQKTILYNTFMKSLDTLAAKTVNFDKFVQNITIYDGSLYEIKVNSSKKDIFDKLSIGFKETFKSDYSIQNKKKKETIFELKKASINKSLAVIDSLKNVYINELSKDNSQTIEVLGNTAFKTGNEVQKTKEFELLQLQITEQMKLTALEEEAINENELFEIISDFQPIGSVYGGILTKMKFVFPIGAFLLSLFLIFGLKFNNFINNYKLN